MRRRLDDRLGASRGIRGLEDPGADEDAVGAELHAKRGIGRCRDTARGERHDRQRPVARDPFHELVRRAQLLRLGVHLFVTQRGEPADVPEDRPHVGHGVHDVARPSLALPADHRRSLGNAPQRFADVRAPAHERRHHRDGHGLLDLADLVRIRHARDAAVPPDVGRNTLQRHHGNGAGVLRDPRLVSGRHVHDHTALEHLGETALHAHRPDVCHDLSVPTYFRQPTTRCISSGGGVIVHRRVAFFCDESTSPR